MDNHTSTPENRRLRGSRKGFNPESAADALPESLKNALHEPVRHLEIRPGLSLSLVDFTPTEDFCIDFETDQAPLEFSFHAAGHARYRVFHPGGKHRFDAAPGLNVASAFPHSEGIMAFFARGPIRMAALHITPEFFQGYLSSSPEANTPELQAFFDSGGRHHLFRPAGMTPAMILSVNQMLACPYHGLARRMFFESKALELLAHQLSRFGEPRPGVRPAPDRREQERLRAARELLVRDLQNPPSLSELAAFAGMSHTKLNRGFKALYGATVFEHLRLRRLAESRRLIEAAEMNIAEIAYETGFSSPSHFARAFHAHFGLRPSDCLREAMSRRTVFA